VFESKSNVTIYALEQIISYAKTHQYIFLAQSIWWISSIIGLQQGLIIHIDNLRKQEDIIQLKIRPDLLDDSCIHPDPVKRIQHSDNQYTDSDINMSSTSEEDIHNEVIENCEDFLRHSKQERKAIGRKNRQASRVIKRKAKKLAKGAIKTFGTQTQGIDGSELRQRKIAGECQRCAWPGHGKGAHKTINYFRWIRKENGTAPIPEKKRYQSIDE